MVDDEPDVLETVAEILDMCTVETARSFDQAHNLLQTGHYDVVILDIMGVKGLDLLDLAVEHDIPAVMLTAPGFNPPYIIESIERGALSCFPKEDLPQLDTLLSEIFAMIDAGVDPVSLTLKRLGPLLAERFPPGWKARLKKGSA